VTITKTAIGCGPYSINGGRPAGDDNFVKKIKKISVRVLALKPKGRPKKIKKKVAVPHNSLDCY